MWCDSFKTDVILSVMPKPSPEHLCWVNWGRTLFWKQKVERRTDGSEAESWAVSESSGFHSEQLDFCYFKDEKGNEDRVLCCCSSQKHWTSVCLDRVMCWAKVLKRPNFSPVPHRVLFRFVVELNTEMSKAQNHLGSVLPGGNVQQMWRIGCSCHA